VVRVGTDVPRPLRAERMSQAGTEGGHDPGA
jgi:hypothetical protein